MPLSLQHELQLIRGGIVVHSNTYQVVIRTHDGPQNHVPPTTLGLHTTFVSDYCLYKYIPPPSASMALLVGLCVMLFLMARYEALGDTPNV